MKIDQEMVGLLSSVLEKHKVAIISGASWKQFENQLLPAFENKKDMQLNNLYLLPISGASLYQIWSKYGWVAVYQNKMSLNEFEVIHKAFAKAIKESGFKQPEKLFGKQLENRECQVTFSALGQKAPLALKAAFDPDFKKRTSLCSFLVKELPDFDVKMGGSTSIDVTLKGLSKRYGIDQLMKHLHVSKDDVLFIGDAIFEGGNDYAPIEMGIEYFKVSGVSDTKKWIANFLAS
jgi:HAD superfamily hydrolase (TIGR01484 family)